LQPDHTFLEKERKFFAAEFNNNVQENLRLEREKEERERLKKVFDFHPQSLGQWLIVLYRAGRSERFHHQLI